MKKLYFLFISLVGFPVFAAYAEPPICASQSIGCLPQARSVFDPSIFFAEVGAGLNWQPGNRDLTDFEQAISGKPGGVGFVSFGGIYHNVFGDVDVGLGVTSQFQTWKPTTLVNMPPYTNSPQGGMARSFSVFPEVTLEGPINGWLGWTAGAGAGVAFQHYEGTDAGDVVLSGDHATAMARVMAGLTVALTPTYTFGLKGYATWLGGYQVLSGGSAPSTFAATTELGVLATLRVEFDGRTFAPLTAEERDIFARQDTIATHQGEYFFDEFESFR